MVADPVSHSDAELYMAQALRLARGGLGRVWPNPSVGCVLVKGGEVVGCGRTADGGRPHAEVVALQRAGAAAQGATAYVTLEPCNHWGVSPPCSEALIDAGVAAVVVAMTDPDPRVNGTGLDALRRAGLAVRVGVLEDQARELNAGFLSRITRGRPVVVGIDVDVSGTSATAHFDAVLLSVRGAKALQNPRSSQRHIVLGHPRQGVSQSCAPREAQLREAGFELLLSPLTAGGEVDFEAALQILGASGLTRVAVARHDELYAAMDQGGWVDRAEDLPEGDTSGR